MELWSQAHIRTLLPAVVVMLLLGTALRLLLKKKPLRQRMLPIKILAVLLVLLEIGKQAMSLYHGYDLYHLPFHFCSLYIFAVPILAFYRGKHEEKVRGVVAALCCSLFLLMLIYPALIYSEGNIQNFFKGYFDFHTVAFHNIVMLVFVLILFLDIHHPEQGEVKPLMLVIVGFCVISASMAYLLKTNYANFYTCNIPPLETVRLMVLDTLGYVLTQLLYVTIVSALNLLFVFGAYWAYRGLRRLFPPVTARQCPATTHPVGQCHEVNEK